jgi:hypothetical protein
MCAAGALMVASFAAAGGTLSFASGRSVATYVASSGTPKVGSTLWRDPFHVVGAPALSGKTIIVFVSGPRDSLSVEGVRAGTGTLLWRRSESASFIATGVDFAPVVDDGVTLVLSPAGSAASGAIRLVGVSVSTGRTAWVGHQIFAATGPPTVCTYAPQDFCVPTGSSEETLLFEVNAKSGRNEGAVPHVLQLLGDGIYETDGVPPTIEAIGLRGHVLWTLSVSRTFHGGSLRDGWFFGREGSVELATVGYRQSGDVQGVFNQTTVGIDPSTGRVLWTDHGAYDCGGLEISGPVVCTGQGTWTFSTVTNTGTLSPGASAGIGGVNPRTGAGLWAFGTTEVWNLLQGNTIPIAGPSDLVLTDVFGRYHLLDLRDGSVTSTSAGSAFWCPTGNNYSVPAPLGGSETRAGTARWYLCDAMTKPTAGRVPAMSAVGIIDGALFIWVATSGLTASRIVL